MVSLKVIYEEQFYLQQFASPSNLYAKVKGNKECGKKLTF